MGQSTKIAEPSKWKETFGVDWKPEYTVYWHEQPHCDQTKMVMQVNRKIAYVCRHEETI